MTWTIDDLIRFQFLEKSGVVFGATGTQLKIEQSQLLSDADKAWIRAKRTDLIEVVALRAEWKSMGGF